MNVFVTIWNRHSWAIPLCEDFTKAGLTVILIDNASTYPPCVEWLNTCPYKVERREKNDGAWAFFITELYQKYADRFFMISDSDQDISGLPKDWVNVLMDGLKETDHGVWKSGLSQRIDDLPNNPYANQIRGYEQEVCWDKPKNKAGYFIAWMDLGIAIYDRTRRIDDPIKESGTKHNWYNAVRSPLPYVSVHRDWYLTADTLRDEDIYYLKHKDRVQDGWLCLLEGKSKNKF